jgi:hypothetical protein
MNLSTAPFKTCLKTCFKVSLAALFLCVIPQVQAGASNRNGSPYGNGTFFRTTGTFSSVVRGENLSGTMLFSTGVSTNSATTNSSGSAVIVYQGYTYRGNAWGMWDPSSGSVNGEFQGGQMLSGTNGTTIWPQIYNTNTFPVPINTISNTIESISTTDPITGVVTTTTTNIPVTNTIYVMPVGTNSFQDAVYMNGSFNGQTQNKYPNQTFTAQGQITQQQLFPQQITQSTNAGAEGTQPVQMAAPLNIPITVQGVRISDSFADFATISNAVPYSMTSYSITNIPSINGGL